MERLQPNSRNLVVVSGYYGFDNLGDEAILEQLVSELKQLVPQDQVVVLSNNPEKTSRLYGISAINRWNLIAYGNLIKRAQLLISGGGGLFQDTTSLKSVLFYGGQILSAHFMGTKILVYAQGIGPLTGTLARFLSAQALKHCNWICVRDISSQRLLQNWGIKAQLTADPVWQLEPSPLPESISTQLAQIEKAPGQLLVGLSLRPSPNLTQQSLDNLTKALLNALPARAQILLLPLQKEQDEPVLLAMGTELEAAGIKVIRLQLDELERPSQWLNLIKHCDLVVSMRLHALIMALSAGLPVVGIAYDPKVNHLLTDFEQPSLNLTNDCSEPQWTNILKASFEGMKELSRQASSKARTAKNLACQNFNLLAKILGMQSDA